eukprot:CAMPEP_0118890536 /NCGR_PEP_ID=MMETSP1166-20130328/954_1 /TAXON_ID=1104430 /ORGANISM="Chrysoreinhardia sp, Strain CCMP3193" /LENGTH=426 /DNA_ID=CAMNT_0006829151 /DNA_START=38 /DNA_END=1318 /DNA_ORIENTATION=-
MSSCRPFETTKRRRRRAWAFFFFFLATAGVNVTAQGNNATGNNATAVPSPLPSLLPTSPLPSLLPTSSAPSFAPTFFCNTSDCLLNGERDPSCCGQRIVAGCSVGAYKSEDVCGDFAGGKLYETCCLVPGLPGSDNGDGLTREEKLAIGLVFGIFGSVCLLCCLRGSYYFARSGFKYPQLGAVGSTVYYDERRGQCFGLIIFLTLFSFVTLIFTYLAASDDVDVLENFAFARVQMKQADTYLVVGLTGYGVVASETKGGTFYEFSDDYGKDSRVGDRSDFDWTGECDTAGAQVVDMLIPVFLAKVACAVIIYLRNNPNTDGVLAKLAGTFLEFFVGLMILAILLAFSLRCLTELPTGTIFLPDDDAQYLYYYDGAEYGEDYTVNFRAPYTSFFTVLLSGLASFYIAWVHWRMSTWGSELVDEDFYG